jgi:SAM-dependent methyltransferase
LGFTNITARGFDVARAQVQRARLLAEDLSGISGVNLTFDVADLTGELPEADDSVDLTLCLYSVLSHLPVASLPKVSTEFARVTSGHFITTVRSVGSTPTISLDAIEKARRFKHDKSQDRCEIELCNGRDIELSFHPFAASELRSYFAEHFDIENLRGLDLFHNRFAPDPRWNPASLALDTQLSNELERLEETYATSSEFVERANHLLPWCAAGKPLPKVGQSQTSDPIHTSRALCSLPKIPLREVMKCALSSCRALSAGS